MREFQRQSALVPENIVSKFVTRVWENPLVSEKTLLHRASGYERMKDLSSQLGISAGSFIGIPVGSTIWVPDGESDFDFVVITDDKKLRRILIDNQIIVHDCHRVDIHDVTVFNGFGGYSYGSAIQLMFTPDEYIFGNRSLAQSVRVSIVQDPNFEKQWNGWVKDLFTIFYLGWPSDVNNHKISATGENRDRKKRFEYQLEMRAQQTRDPEAWKRGFLKAMNSIAFPDPSTFEQAMLNTSGRLNLDQRYKAQMVDEKDQQLAA